MQQAAANGRRQRSRTEDEMAPIEDHVCAKLRPAFYKTAAALQKEKEHYHRYRQQAPYNHYG
jgi:hypothetical protein